mgnify:CR=1 FL=1
MNLAVAGDLDGAYAKLETVEHAARILLVAHLLGGANPLTAARATMPAIKAALPPLLSPMSFVPHFHADGRHYPTAIGLVRDRHSACCQRCQLLMTITGAGIQS